MRRRGASGSSTGIALSSALVYGMRGAREQRARVAHLHDPPAVHHRHAVADVLHEPQVVGDEEIRQLQPRLQVQKQLHHLRLNRDVQRRHGLVGDDERRAERQRARDADALPLAAAELVRIPVQVAALEPHEIEELGHPCPALLARAQLVDDERLLHDVAHAHPRVERRVGILEDDLHVAARQPHPLARERQDVLAAEPDLARRGLHQAQHAPARWCSCRSPTRRPARTSRPRRSRSPRRPRP